MRILLINVPHLSIGSRIPDEHLPPLGLLAIGGPLIDSGNEVKLLDADYLYLNNDEILKETMAYNPEAVLMGHSGSSSAQPIISEITKLIRHNLPAVKIIIGGVYPTYHWKEILEKEPQIDVIVCGEGEETIQILIKAIDYNKSLDDVKGIAFRKNGVPQKTAPATLIKDLDKYRIGWELMGSNKYKYWGDKSAVVVQFSRGCTHQCSYCGQTLFWKEWRHRNPRLFAKELAMLHKEYGIKVFNFADENPGINKKAWKEFLLAIIEENVPIILVGSIRADIIVRDADILHLYKKAGFERFLLGIENTDESVLKSIKKDSSISNDREAINLLRKNNILSMVTYVYGFGEEKISDFIRSFKNLRSYDPDQIQLLYATPHRWTPIFDKIKEKRIIQADQRKWDYKHQVLATENLKPWIVMLFVKTIEVLMQLRPKSLFRLFFHNDKSIREAIRWYYKIGRKVWFYELYHFFFKEKRPKNGMSLKEFWE